MKEKIFTKRSFLISGAVGLILIAVAVLYVCNRPRPVQYHTHFLSPGNYVNGVRPAPGDTVFLRPGVYGYVSWSGISGDSARPITLTGEGVKLTAGFEFSDCKYWHVTGGAASGITIENPKTVAVHVKGKSGGFEIDHIKFINVFSAIWFKTEPEQYRDSTYWTSLTMRGLYVHDITARRCGFEGFYIGSTNQKADRPCTGADGKTYYPFPASVQDVRLERCFIDSCYRTGAQISGLLAGNNYVKNCVISVCGLGYESSQGACLRIGGRSTGIKITGNTFSHSWLYAFQSQAGGTVKFLKNKIDSATRVIITNPQKMAGSEFDVYKHPTTLKIKNNTVSWSNGGVAYVVYANNNLLTKEGNAFINNTGLFQNFTDVQFETAAVKFRHKKTVLFIGSGLLILAVLWYTNRRVKGIRT